MRLELTRRFRKDLARLTAQEQALVSSALELLPATWGHPHLHTGLGIRILIPGVVYECRPSRPLRVVFMPRGDILYICMVGNHDEVRAFLRTF